MREILFRGKQSDNGKWVYGAFCPKSCDLPFGPMVDRPSIIKLENPCSGFWVDVTPETIGQYTGLTDKNGKRIFEGDILRWTADDGESGVVYVEYSGGAFGLYCSYCPDMFADFEEGEQPLEVIGNIHDDPELLETRRESIEQA